MRISLVADALVFLLLTGCNGATTASHGPITTSAGNSPGTGPATEVAGTPSAEGTGMESPQHPTSGGVSLSVPALPIGPGDGGGNVTPQDVCVDLKWLGTLRPMVVLTVTNVVINGPFDPVSLVKAGCTGDDGPACVGLRLTAADNGGMPCAVGLAGPKVRVTQASVELAGELSCPGLDSATCQHVHSGLEAQAQAKGFSISFDFDIPPPTSSTSPPPTSSTSPPASSGSPSPTNTSSQSSPNTSSP